MVAKDLVSSNMLDRVAKWGIQSEHNGVSGEASRLLARIVRQLQMQNFIIKVVEVLLIFIGHTNSFKIFV